MRRAKVLKKKGRWGDDIHSKGKKGGGKKTSKVKERKRRKGCDNKLNVQEREKIIVPSMSPEPTAGSSYTSNSRTDGRVSD
jgi:hypothetical protein